MAGEISLTILAIKGLKLMKKYSIFDVFQERKVSKDELKELRIGRSDIRVLRYFGATCNLEGTCIFQAIYCALDDGYYFVKVYFVSLTGEEIQPHLLHLIDALYYLGIHISPKTLKSVTSYNEDRTVLTATFTKEVFSKIK